LSSEDRSFCYSTAAFADSHVGDLPAERSSSDHSRRKCRHSASSGD
jgi:hypothetical protein